MPLASRLSLGYTAQGLSKKYNLKLITALAPLLEKYPDFIKVYDLYTNADKFIGQLLAEGKIISDPSVLESISYSYHIWGNTLNVNANFFGSATPDNIDDFVFFDLVHPNRILHRLIGDDVFENYKKWLS